MAGLADQINNSGVGNTPKQEEDLQGLTDAAGMEQSPLTPLGASGIGANEDSAKMAGSKAQKPSALTPQQQEQEAPQDLQTTLRQQEVRGPTPADEATKELFSKVQEGLGSLEGRVDAYAADYFGKNFTASTGISDLTLQADVSEIEMFSGAGITGEQLQAITADGIQGQELIDLAKQINPDDPYSLIQGGPEATAFQAAINQAYGADAGAMINSAITEVTGDFSVADILQGEDGAATANALEELGIDGWEEMSIEDLQHTIQTKLNEEFSRVEDLRDLANDPRASAADRAAARAELLEAGAAGVTATEAEVDQLQESVDAAEEIEFMGESASITDLLGDENISEKITEYLNDPESTIFDGEEFAGLRDYIEKNRSALADAAAQVEKTAKESETEVNEQLVASLEGMKGFFGDGFDPDNEEHLDMIGTIAGVAGGSFKNGVLLDKNGNPLDIQKEFAGKQGFLDVMGGKSGVEDPALYLKNIMSLEGRSKGDFDFYMNNPVSQHKNGPYGDISGDDFGIKLDLADLKYKADNFEDIPGGYEKAAWDILYPNTDVSSLVDTIGLPEGMSIDDYLKDPRGVPSIEEMAADHKNPALFRTIANFGKDGISKDEVTQLMDDPKYNFANQIDDLVEAGLIDYPNAQHFYFENKFNEIKGDMFEGTDLWDITDKAPSGSMSQEEIDILTTFMDSSTGNEMDGAMKSIVKGWLDQNQKYKDNLAAKKALESIKAGVRGSKPKPPQHHGGYVPNFDDEGSLDPGGLARNISDQMGGVSRSGDRAKAALKKRGVGGGLADVLVEGSGIGMLSRFAGDAEKKAKKARKAGKKLSIGFKKGKKRAKKAGRKISKGAKKAGGAISKAWKSI